MTVPTSTPKAKPVLTNSKPASVVNNTIPTSHTNSMPAPSPTATMPASLTNSKSAMPASPALARSTSTPPPTKQNSTTAAAATSSSIFRAYARELEKSAIDRRLDRTLRDLRARAAAKGGKSGYLHGAPAGKAGASVRLSSAVYPLATSDDIFEYDLLQSYVRNRRRAAKQKRPIKSKL